MLNDRPPDSWDDSVPNAGNGEQVNEPLMKQASDLRAAWILAVRSHVQRQNGGEPCSYNSNLKWDGGLCRATRRNYKPVWPKLVLQARSEGLDPIRLVTVLFAAWGTGPSPNTPNLMLSPENVARYHRHLRNTENRIRIRLGTDESIYLSAVRSVNFVIADPDAAARFVLNDLGRKLSPLFRYSIATMKNMADVADRWRALAMDQLAQAPESYLEAWSNIIPQDITAAARAASGKVA